ncbi:PREDICTED: uncharacterized protein LOC108772866 [Cyphomyrmex costatus]|uniref:uncharacterized protein LOC108772866 n=1 Tax=Cyphomyrmex costatus TaxID=456900 RepID=UPI0008522B4A|nr:PREDICTED: uncharacterized protein LOC108772866 [Cyphomyrmex costatus]
MDIGGVTNDSEIGREASVPVDLIAGYDAGWQKRGTGHSYNSLSGHGTLIGHYSGKIISYAVQCTTCRKCSLGQNNKEHDCRKNYKGSAKAMEPDMAVELIHKNVLFKQENVRITVLIGDDDSSTIAAVRRAASYEIYKWSDYNHTHKSMTSALYTLKLSPKHIEYFSHCFSHAVKQNKGDAAKIEKALRSVVPHAFGDHTLCGDWCAGKSNPNVSYVHKNLPNGKPIQNTDLRVSLTKIFSRYADNAKKIANCGSTQGNESVNHMIASKNPKSRHYSASDSLSFRVAAAKKRRLQLKKLRKSKNSINSRKEGVTYESGVSLDDVSAVLPKLIPEIKDYTLECLNKFKVVIFYLETTGLSKNDEICQIAACTEENSFNAYIIPSKNISKKAYEITGLQLIAGDLYYGDEKVEAFPVKIACTNFLTYLQSFKCPIILLAHNAFSFDMPRIINLVADLGLIKEFKSIVCGCSDSLHPR